MITRRRALVELCIAGVIWGFGFVATVWALRHHTPSELLTLRYLVAILGAELLRALWSGLRRNSPRLTPLRSDVHLSVLAGLLLSLMLLFQTIGLQFTTASKSGFLTALYVIFVPVLAHFLLRQRQSLRVFAYAALALVGAALLMGADLRSLNPGDLWTVACALLAAFHILYIETVTHRIKDPFRFNTLQTGFCLIVVIPLLLMQDQINLWSTDPLTWIGILALALGSTVFGFTAQLRAQRVLDATTASMLFLLESPFALLFGILLLSEGFSGVQALGAVLILLAAVFTTRISRVEVSGP